MTRSVEEINEGRANLHWVAFGAPGQLQGNNLMTQKNMVVVYPPHYQSICALFLLWEP